MDYTLAPSDTFPVGSTVAVYPVTNWPNSIVKEDAAPVGSATDSDTMGASSVTFQGLTAGLPYVAYALVGSTHRYLRINPGQDSSLDIVPGQRLVRATITADVDNIATETTLITCPSVTLGARPVIIRFNAVKLVNDTASGFAIVRIKRDGTTIHSCTSVNNADTAGLVPGPYALECEDTPGPGSYVYTVTALAFLAGNVDVSATAENEAELKVIAC